MYTRLISSMAAATLLGLLPAAAQAAPFIFSNGNVNGLMATASRPSAGGVTEIESADDFVLTDQTQITSATFTGLLTSGVAAPAVGQVVVEIYRVFPNDSNVGRTSGSPTFSTSQVPTRVNSPSDVALASRDTAAGTLTLTTSVLASTFTASNSVAPGGIHPAPGQTTGGNGAVTGQEVQFNAAFTTPLDLAPGHYFFVPQVQVTGGTFYWLSSIRPIAAPGTPFAPDLQAWARDGNLDPDWLRIGTDIVGSVNGVVSTFNEAFTLNGVTVPEPMSVTLMASALLGLAGLRRSRYLGA